MSNRVSNNLSEAAVEVMKLLLIISAGCLELVVLL